MNTLYTLVAAAPIFYLVTDSHTKAQKVIIRTETEGATIYYTLDGTDPTTNSMVYTTPIFISETTTIRAFATSSGMDDSYVSTATYTILEGTTESTRTDFEGMDLSKASELKRSDVEDHVFGVKNAIVVRSKSLSYFAISDASGQDVRSGVTNVGETIVDVTAGVYQVRIGKETYEVLVK